MKEEFVLMSLLPTFYHCICYFALQNIFRSDIRQALGILRNIFLIFLLKGCDEVSTPPIDLYPWQSASCALDLWGRQNLWGGPGNQEPSSMDFPEMAKEWFVTQKWIFNNMLVFLHVGRCSRHQSGQNPLQCRKGIQQSWIETSWEWRERQLWPQS